MPVGNPVQPAETAMQEDAGPLLLNEAADFVRQYVVASPAQIDAMVLVAACTHLKEAFVAFPRVLFTSESPESGKTEALRITAALCSKPFNTKGTGYALQSKLAAQANEPGAASMTLIRDEISDIFGQAGLNGSQNPIAGILREGYKRGATMCWSVSRTAVDFDISGIFLMAGLRTAVPVDIRTRCIVITMRPGSPAGYFDIRTGEPVAERIAKTLAAWTKAHRPEITSFLARDLHPKLKGRRREIWEPLFAVAAAAGQDWLNRCLTAFLEIALDESDQTPLSPRQEVLRDLHAVVQSGMPLYAGGVFAGGMDLADQLLRLPDTNLYSARSRVGVAKMIADAMPVPPKQLRVGEGQRVRGYMVEMIEVAWMQVAPAASLDALIPDEASPFDVDSDDSDPASEKVFENDVAACVVTTGSTDSDSGGESL